VDYEIKEERFSSVLKEMTPMNIEHYEEVAMFQDKIDLSPMYEEYFGLEDLGMLAVFTVRSSERLVGYSIFFIRNHVHYGQSTWAFNDIIFLDKEFRNSSASKDLMDFSVKCLKERGVDVVTMHMKVSKPFHTLMDRCGFNHAENVYLKYIGE
jgi:GNAT superfamily N-acetyltransferase